MNQPRKKTLVVLLFPYFGTPELPSLREAFMDLLKKALVVVDMELRVLEYQPRYTPMFREAFLKQLAEEWDGDIALICFTGSDDLVSAKSKIGTLYERVKELRVQTREKRDKTRMVLVTTHEQMFEACQRDYFPWSGSEGTVSRPILLIRTAAEYGIMVVREVSDYIGTSDRPRMPTSTFLAAVSPSRDDETGEQELQTPAPPRKQRSDETQVGIREVEPGTGKVLGMRPSRPDGPDEEDERPTMNPPPPDIPFRPKQ